MSSELPATLFELSQIMAQQTRKALADAIAAHGYADVSLPGARLIWEVSTGARNIQQLAERTGTTKQFCARETARLRDCGYLETRPDQNDKRSVRVVLTKKGAAALSELRAVKLGLEDEMRAKIGDAAYEAALKAMTDLLGGAG